MGRPVGRRAIAQYERYGKLQSEMEEHGHYVAGDELEPAAAARLVRVERRDARLRRTLRRDERAARGAFHGGCDLETALAYAAQIPAAEGGTIEVRPIVEGPDA